MNLKFTKYQGTGNDFILINGFTSDLKTILDQDFIKLLCNRHYGIGADGLIIIEPSQKADFKMVYYNCDGKKSSMCGNGGRCAAKYANEHGRCDNDCSLEAIDGIHIAKIGPDHFVQLSMGDVANIEKLNDQTFVLDTGSPHYVHFENNPGTLDIQEFGPRIRYSKPFRKEGINVNLAHIEDNMIKLKTYERGVENETLSCGTGVTATAICASIIAPDLHKRDKVLVQTKGGNLTVKFKKTESRVYTDVWLCGNAMKVFEGQVLL